MRRRVIRGNPLRNPTILKKLNPHSAMLKKAARITNAKRQQARQVLLRKRSGEKVDESDLKKANATLGLKGTPAKVFRAQLKEKAEKRKAKLNKMKLAAEKRKEKAKANAANPRKSTKTAAKKK